MELPKIENRNRKSLSELLLEVIAMYYLKGIIIAIYCLLCFDLIPHPRSMPPKKGSYQKRKISTDVAEVALAGFASVVGRQIHECFSQSNFS